MSFEIHLAETILTKSRESHTFSKKKNIPSPSHGENHDLVVTKSVLAMVVCNLKR